MSRQQDAALALKPFSEWAEVFANATGVVTLVDRLVHRSEIISIEGDSCRLKEAKDGAARQEAGRRGHQETMTLLRLQH